MNKNKLLVLGPITADAAHLEQLRKPLDFLSQDYEINLFDPLCFDCSDSRSFYQQWQQKLKELWPDYQLIIGFSFGGMILQKFLTECRVEDKKMVLFSAPVFSDQQLRAKLQQVVSYCEQERLAEALEILYTWVYAPGQAPALSLPEDTASACKRLIAGLNLVIETDLRADINNIRQSFLHFYGENSALVGRAQLGECFKAEFIEVKQASMRVLEDQPVFCQQKLLAII